MGSLALLGHCSEKKCLREKEAVYVYEKSIGTRVASAVLHHSPYPLLYKLGSCRPVSSSSSPDQTWITHTDPTTLATDQHPKFITATILKAQIASGP